MRVIHSYPTDDVHRNYILDELFTGELTVSVEGNKYDHVGPPSREGPPIYMPGDEVGTVIVGMENQREFNVAGKVTHIQTDTGEEVSL